MGKLWNLWLAAAYGTLGVQAAKVAFEYANKPVNGLGDLGSGSSSSNTLPGERQRASEAMARAGAILTKSSMHAVRNIDERVAYIRPRIESGSLHPAVREAAISVVSTKCFTKGEVRWCTNPKDFLGEIAAVYNAVQQAKSPIAVRYVRDHVRVDQFTEANKLLRLRGGDCDDGTIILGSLLMSIGYPVRMRVIQDTSAQSWSHIYLLVGLPPGKPTSWMPLDWSVVPFRPPGWQPPGADVVAKTGRPAGIVVKVKDYEV